MSTSSGRTASKYTNRPVIVPSFHSQLTTNLLSRGINIMACIVNQKSGCRTIQFVGAGRRRKSIRLGKMSQRQAEAIKFRVEQLIAAQRSGVPVDAETAGWLSKLDDTMADRLAAVGLMPSRKRDGQANMGPFLDAYLKRRTDVKPATKEVWRQVMLNLKNFFGDARALESISEGDAEDFKLYLIGEKLASTTVHKRLQFARMFFRDARRRGLIFENPFLEVRSKPVNLRDRHRFISQEDTERILAMCNPIWRTIIGLCRYAGLRCPSEVLSLRWELVDWEHDRMVVDSPKTEHHPGGQQRVMPIFPELRPILEEAFELAEPGAKYVVGGGYREAARRAGRWVNCNLRTHFCRLIKRAGLTPWPRLFHNLRSSRETELARQFPLHVVTRWLGNTPRIAMKHYLQVTEDDFARAVGKTNGDFTTSKTMATAPAAPIPETDSTRKSDPRHDVSTEGSHPGSAVGKEDSNTCKRDDPHLSGRAAERGAVVAQNAVQSAHVRVCQAVTAQNKTPVATGVYAHPGTRRHRLPKWQNGEDRNSTTPETPEKTAIFKAACRMRCSHN